MFQVQGQPELQGKFQANQDPVSKNKTKKLMRARMIYSFKPPSPSCLGEHQAESENLLQQRVARDTDLFFDNPSVKWVHDSAYPPGKQQLKCVSLLTTL